MTDSKVSAYEAAAAAVRTHLLPNGVTAILWPEPRDTVVSVQIWVRTGSSDEVAGKTGLAHMLEHLMFRGTERVPDGEFDRRMEALGASINAATWLDFTAYTATAPPESLAEILALEADRFAGLALTPAVFSAERSVVANERRQVVEADPVARLHETLFARTLGGSNYAWPTIGFSEDIAGYELDDVLAFHRRHYAPSRLAVVVCGCATESEMLAAIGASFGALAEREAPARHFTAPTIAACDDVMPLPVSSARVSLAWQCPPRTDLRHAAWTLFNEVLCGGESSRLPARLEMNDRSVLDVSSQLGAHAHTAMFNVEATLRARVRPASVVAAIDDEIARLASEGPTPRELNAARMRMRTQDATALATTSSRADWAGESWVVAGDPLQSFRLADAVAALDIDDVRAVARELAAAPRVVLKAMPETAA